VLVTAAAAAIAAFVLAPAAVAAPRVQLVLRNDAFAMLAVDSGGTAYGVATSGS
jgi:hypothetical protein